MPVVSRYGDLKVAPAPLVGVRKTQAETPTSEGAGLAEAEGQKDLVAGQAIGGPIEQLGETLFAKQQEAARQRAENVQVLAGDTDLANLQLDRLHDPQHGVLNTVHGKDALDLMESEGAVFDEKASAIAATMPPRAQARFLEIVHRRRLAQDEILTTHATQELDAYEANETKAALTSARELAVANIASNPDIAKQEVARTDAFVNHLADQQAAGPAQRAYMLETQRTAIHLGAIDLFLARGEDRQAQLYYEHVKDEIAVDHRATVETKLDGATTAGEGVRAADAIMARLGPKDGDDTDTINVDRIEAAARAQFGDDAKGLHATLAELHAQIAGIEAGRKNRAEATAGALYVAASQGATLEQLRRMQEFNNAPGHVQAQLTDYVVNKAEREANRAYADEGRADTRARRMEAEKEGAGWARFYDLSQPQVLAATSENALNALRGELGDGHVNRLIEDRRKLVASDAKVRSATIDRDLFNTIAASAGLNPYAKTGDQTTSDKARLGQLENTTKQAIDDEQIAKGKELTREQKAAVMQHVVDQHVMLHNYFSADTSVPAAVVNPKERASAYVKLADIPAPSLNAWVNVIRSQFPREQTATRDDIVKRYADRIQRAQAAHLLKLGTEEELSRLLGR